MKPDAPPRLALPLPTAGVKRARHDLDDPRDDQPAAAPGEESPAVWPTSAPSITLADGETPANPPNSTADTLSASATATPPPSQPPPSSGGGLGWYAAAGVGLVAAAGIGDHRREQQTDTGAPFVENATPAANASEVAVTGDLVFQFNEAIQRGSGKIVLSSSFGATVAVYDAATSGNLSIDGGKLTLDPAAALRPGTEYRLSFDAGAITDLAGNGYVNTDGWRFTTAGPPSAYTPGQPVINLGDYGQLIHPVKVDGENWFYAWDINGDGKQDTGEDASGRWTHNGDVASATGTGYRFDRVTHGVLDGLFRQNADGAGGDSDERTDAVYRHATLNGVHLALPTLGDTTAATGNRTGGETDNNPVGENNPRYDDLLAIWDGHNGNDAGSGSDGTPSGWQAALYWSATPTVRGFAALNLENGFASGFESFNFYVAVQVL